MARAEPHSHTVLITGATDGIGLLLAKAYASRGHKVLATGRRTIVDDLEFFGQPNITYITADQASPKPAAQAIAFAMRDLGWTQLDLAILNGATGWTGKPWDETPNDIAEQISINLAAPVMITQALAPWLFVGSGKLAFIGSTAVAKGNGAFATYIATKAGLDGFARSLREEWAGKAEVLMIHPGPTRTSMHEKAGMKPGLIRRLFMSPKRAAKAIQKAIRKGNRRRMITRGYGWRSIFSGAREGVL